MDVFNTENFNRKSLDHLGLVADKIEDLSLIQRIDAKLPLSVGSKVTMGERVATMILNGLGFIDARLYVFPQFVERIPVNRLQGREIDASERMKDFCKHLPCAPESLYVGDPAMYENIVKKSSDMKWLSRVPEKIKSVNQFIDQPEEKLRWAMLSEDFFIMSGVRHRHEVRCLAPLMIN